MAKTRISVLMPAYNAEKFIAKAIESILSQKHNAMEFIIVDDASSDDTYGIIAGYADPRIRAVRNERNIGQTRSLNKAAGMAESEFLARIDADDIAVPERLGEQFDYLSVHEEISVLGTSAIAIDASGREIGSYPACADPEETRMDILFGNPLVHSSVMMRRSDFFGTGGYDEKFAWCQDYDLWSRMLATGYRIANISKPLVLLRMHGNSVSSSMHADKFYIEAPRVFKDNFYRLCGVDVSICEAEDICRAIYNPLTLDEARFEKSITLIETILAAYKEKNAACAGIAGRNMAKMRYILGISCMDRGRIGMARRRFIDSFRAYPRSPNPLACYFFSLFGRRVCEFARSAARSLSGRPPAGNRL